MVAWDMIILCLTKYLKLETHYKINAPILNRWSAKSMIGAGIALSLITLAIIFINGTTQVASGLGTQFSFGTYNHTGLEQNTRAFLDNLQQKGGPAV
jgi:hypothetical protein